MALVELGQLQYALARLRDVGDADARRNATEWTTFVNEKSELKAALSR